MTGRKDRRKADRFRKPLGKREAMLACLVMCLLSIGDTGISMASDISLPGEKETRETDPEAYESMDFDDFEGDVTEDELDRALEEYINQLDFDSLIKGDKTVGKVTDPVLKTELLRDGAFRYVLPNGNYFISSVPKGMVTAGAVDLTLQAGTVGLVRYEDESETFTDSWHFTKEGTYQVRLLMYQQFTDTTTDYNLYEIPFCFTIIGKRDNTLGIYPAPEGFALKEVRRDGRPLEIQSQRGFFLGEDGRYEMVCEALWQEGVLVRTEFVRDTTAPFLSFFEEPGREAVLGPVEFAPSEDNCRIYMNYNGNRGYAAGTVLTAPGSYELSVQDEAGNERVYHIRIRQTYDLGDRRVIAAILVILVMVAARLLILRRDMRVL